MPKRKLASMGWLEAMPSGFQDDVLDRVEVRSAPAGSPLYLLGEEARGLHGLTEGTVEVSIVPSREDPALIYLARRGWWFGALEIFTTRPRRFQIQARTDCEFLFLSAKNVREICGLAPENWECFARLMCANYEAMADAVAMMRHPSPVWRVSRALLILHYRQTELVAEIEATQADIASIANVSPRSAANALAELESQSLIERGYGTVRVLDPEKLADSVGSEAT